MKVFAELTLRDDSLDSLIAALKTYCDAVEGWCTDEKKNQDYSVMQGSASFWVIPPRDILRVPVAIALAGCKSSSGEMRISNIVPQESGQISIDEYNHAAGEFVRHLRALLKRKVIRRVRVEYSAGDIGLEGVITGPSTRRYFEQFMAGYPTSYHPCDIERLDTFIVALHRGGRCADAYRIRDYLCQDEGWSEKDSTWVRDRIITGLEVLRVNRKFWRRLA